jgi:hypothetical protein
VVSSQILELFVQARMLPSVLLVSFPAIASLLVTKKEDRQHHAASPSPSVSCIEVDLVAVLRPDALGNEIVIGGFMPSVSIEFRLSAMSRILVNGNISA